MAVIPSSVYIPANSHSGFFLIYAVLKKLESSRYLVGETGNKWEDEKNAHVGQIVLDSINDKEAEEYYSMFHPQEDVVLVVLDTNGLE